jgi:hypothetical protein
MWTCPSFRFFSDELGNDVDGFGEDVFFLGEGEGGDVFVGVAVETSVGGRREGKRRKRCGYRSARVG